MDLRQMMQHLGEQARDAALELATASSSQKNEALRLMAEALRQHSNTILKENAKDVSMARANYLSSAILDRLMLDEQRIEAMAQGLEQVSQLPNPTDRVLEIIEPKNGLTIKKVSVPIGVIGMIYESRPNVTADVAGLCLKAGNAVILRGGAEAQNSNTAITNALLEGLGESSISPYAIQLVPSTDRAAVHELVQMQRYVDLVIPRGGEGLIKSVSENARVPVIKHYKGICHIYVDKAADLTMAKTIIENAKCSRPAVCNALESLLIHEAVANELLPELFEQLQNLGVECRGDEKALRIEPGMLLANEKDWATEYLDLVLSIKVVNSMEEAIWHINHYGSHHSDSIISDDTKAQQRFTNEVDSAVVYINASTRFTDGAEFGMGAEIGISTDKLHARGPMGLNELTTIKYVATGTGQVRA